MKRLQRRTVHFLVLTVLISGAFSLVLTTGARRVRAAATYFVTNKNDSGDGSLRQALERAISGDTVKFASSVRGEMFIDGLSVKAGVTITGPGRDQLTLWGGQHFPYIETIEVFSGNGEVTTISGLTLYGGAARFGGAILNRGNLVVKDCDLLNNSSFHNDAIVGSGAGGAIYNSGQLTIKNCLIRQGAGHGPGGAIYSRGQLTISDSTLENSTSSGTADGESGGGAIFINSQCTAVITNTTIRNNQSFSTGGGGITNEGFVTMENCTINDNGSVESGGGIENLHSITLTQCTIANNTAVRAGGGVASLAGPGEDRTAVLRACTVTSNSTSGTDGGSGAGGLVGLKEWSIQLLNTIVAGNKENSDFSDDPDVGGPFTSFGHNLIGHTVSTGWLGTDKTNVDPLFVLDADGKPLLADNGGHTKTVALKLGSPAIDAGDDSIVPGLVPDTDQRGPGFHRLVDGNADRAPRIDIGAFEVQANAYPTLTVVNTFFITVNTTLSPKVIGKALDKETIPSRLTLLINGGETATVNGVFLAALIATDGTINATVRAACESDDATFTLRLVDENNQGVEGTLKIRTSRPPPTITANDITVNAPAGQCSATIPFSATVVDGCGNPMTGTYGIGQTEITSPHTFPVGVTTVSVWAIEPVTQEPNTGSFRVIVKDVSIPEITSPGDITKNTDPGQCSAVVSFAPAATDLCDPNPSVVCTPASGSTFPKGTSTVNCTVTDHSGNSAACSFRVLVIDNQAPVFGSCANIVTSAASGQCSAAVSYTRSATDSCDGARTVTCNPASGSTFQKGVTTVNCTASDTSGNTGQCSFTVTVNDTQAPTINCPGNITAGNDPNRCSAVVPFNVTAADNCGAVTPVCAPPSGSSFPKGSSTVTFSASDAAGNSSSCSFTVTIRDIQPPAIVCPASVTAVFSVAGSSTGTVNYPMPAASDNCAILSVACTPPSGSAFPLGTTTVTCIATDTSANTVTCSFVVNTFDACLQDDSMSDTVLLWNSATGDYRFCCGGTSYEGKGTVARKGNIFTLTDNSATRRMMATVDTSQNKGNASLQTPPGVNKCSITDRDTRNNTCSCR